MRASYVFAVVASLSLTGIPQPASAQSDQSDLHARAQKSDAVVVGTMVEVTPVFETNEFGDQLIVSKVTVRVDETMKGNGQSVLDLSVEGGTIGDLTLDVSDMPPVKRGERATLFLDRRGDGSFIPHDRGLGIMSLDANDRVVGNGLTLEEIRAAVKGQR